jgi:hypothetical protein
MAIKKPLYRIDILANNLMRGEFFPPRRVGQIRAAFALHTKQKVLAKLCKRQVALPCLVPQIHNKKSGHGTADLFCPPARNYMLKKSGAVNGMLATTEIVSVRDGLMSPATSTISSVTSGMGLSSKRDSDPLSDSGEVDEEDMMSCKWKDCKLKFSSAAELYVSVMPMAFWNGD